MVGSVGISDISDPLLKLIQVKLGEDLEEVRSRRKVLVLIAHRFCCFVFSFLLLERFLNSLVSSTSAS